MKTRNLVMLTLLLCVVAFSSTLVGYISGAHASQKKKSPVPNSVTNQPQLQSVSKEAQNSAPIDFSLEKEEKIKFVLKENNGNLALFSTNGSNEEMYQQYDICIDYLPRSDRELLKKGIEVDTLEEALQMLEDYIS